MMRFFTRNVALDLGSYSTRVFVGGEGVVFDEPSVVAISKEEKELLSTGKGAKEMAGRAPGDIVIIKPIEEGLIVDQNGARLLIQNTLKKVLGFGLFKPNAVVALPAIITSMEERALTEIYISSGIKSVYTIPDTLLASIGSGVKVDELRGRMIVDIGGGKTDISVISLGGILSSSSVNTGGLRIDKAIVDYVDVTHNLLIGFHTAELIKKKIGSAISVQKPTKVSIKGRDKASGLPRTILIDTNEINRAIAIELERIIEAIGRVFRKTPPELTSDIIDYGIILTGGTALLKNLDKFVSRSVDIPVLIAEDPKNAVIRGAGSILQTGHMKRYRKTLLTK